MRKSVNKLLCILLTILTVLSLVACKKVEDDTVSNIAEGLPDDDTLAKMKMSEAGSIYSDVVEGIDHSSIVVEGNTTFFNSIMSDGTVVRFEGENIALSVDGITLSPESSLISLDAMGKIYVYLATVKDGAVPSIGEQWLDIGYGYVFFGNRTAVDRAEKVYTELRGGIPVTALNQDASLSLAYFEPNYLFVKGANGNTEDITLTSLTVGYNPSEKITEISEVKEILPDYFYAAAEAGSEVVETGEEESAENITEAIDVQDPESYDNEYTEPVTAESLAATKMGESGSLYSDIVAGIEPATISVEGNTTRFSSIMSDGTTIRFEGKNVSITNNGIVMNPNSQVASLDAVGKIYEYHAAVQNKEQDSVRDQTLNVGYGYSFSAEKTSVNSAEELRTFAISGYPAFVWSEETSISVAYYEPNFVFFEAASYNAESFVLTSLTIGYNPDEKVTAIVGAELNPAFYGYYLEGEPYNYTKETKADEEKSVFDFYLVLKQEALESIDYQEDHYLYFLSNTLYNVGELRDAEGNVLDKETARVYKGYTLDITVGDYTLAVELPVTERVANAQTLKEIRPYSTQSALGAQNVLVVPVVWVDQTELVSDDLYAIYQKALGNLIDEKGNFIGNHSDNNDEVFSLTEYFDTASYSQLSISSFMTDWYYSDKAFSGEYEYIFPEVEFAEEVLSWVKDVYPDTDWSKFDQDGDGYVDAIILISVGQSQDNSYMPASFGGTVHSTGSQFSNLKGTQANPKANCFLTVNHCFLEDGKTNTLIHEFSHNFGLNDYYDGSYSGISPLGGFDMQDSNVGDWNSYSKLAVGWMNSQVVTNLASGESVELTIGSSALTGDVIILPAAGAEYDGPFGEYVMIDLFSPDGANALDAAQYGLEDTVGVRISHVNANMRYENKNQETVGTEMYTNNYVNGGHGIYNIELIQSGKKNTLSSLSGNNPTLNPEDFFYAGNEFTAEGYAEFFYEGLMDNGMALGYTVRILSIDVNEGGNPTATIQITAN